MSARSISSYARPITCTSSRLASNSARSGISFRHGAHHVAQKFTTTHFPRCRARSKWPPSKVSIDSDGNSGLAGVAGAAGAGAGAGAGAAGADGGAGAAASGAGAGARSQAPSTATNASAKRWRKLGMGFPLRMEEAGDAAVERIVERAAQLVHRQAGGAAERVGARGQLEVGGRHAQPAMIVELGQRHVREVAA